MRVRDQLRAGVSLVALKERLALGQLKKIVGTRLDIVVSGNDKAAGSWMSSPGCGFVSRTRQSIRGRGVKYCPAPNFFSAAFFSSKPS